MTIDEKLFLATFKALLLQVHELTAIVHIVSQTLRSQGLLNPDLLIQVEEQYRHSEQYLATQKAIESVASTEDVLAALRDYQGPIQ